MATLASLLADAETPEKRSPHRSPETTASATASCGERPHSTVDSNASVGGTKGCSGRRCLPLPHIPSCLAVSKFHKGCIISGSCDRTTRIWDAESGEVHRVLRGHGGEVSCLSIADDAPTLCSGAIDGSIRVFSTLTGACSRCIEVPQCCSMLGSSSVHRDRIRARALYYALLCVVALPFKYRVKVLRIGVL